MGEMLRKEGFDSVYAGVRKEDGKEVTIKHAEKKHFDEFITIPGETTHLPLEVALMKMVCRPPRCENVLELLEWFETSRFFILVLERPNQCMDLHLFCKQNNLRQLSESVAQKIIWQVVLAAHHCYIRGVFHRDIKPENILINPDTLEVKLMNFSCGALLMNEPYTSYAGIPAYSPPEYVLQREYFGVPAAVWSLGILMFELVCGMRPFTSKEDITDGHLWFISHLSCACCELITWCLDKDSEDRPTFEQILSHRWFKEIVQETVKPSEKLLPLTKEGNAEWLRKLENLCRKIQLTSSRSSNDSGDCDKKYKSEMLSFPGPLMSANMQMDKLMRFIQGKCQECLCHLDSPEQQFCYFFWLIMKHTCNQNGLGCVEDQEDWCIYLGNLLHSKSPANELREDIIKMGDSFASRGWMYAAHICYVEAQIELGSRQHFELIGYKSEPETKQALREAIERTEVYEYLLYLTSGFSQPHFQMFKVFYAFELFDRGLHYQALDYCESIAGTLLKFPHLIDGHVMRAVKMLSEKLLQLTKKKKDPEWLKKLHSLCRKIRFASFSSSNGRKQARSCRSKRNTALKDIHPSEQNEFESRYTMGKRLGKGGFGSVYVGVRKADGKEVAIKHAKKHHCDKYISIPGETQRLPLEVALMKMVSRHPCCENVVQLLEWFETSRSFILVLELPNPCMDLHRFCKRNNLRRLAEPVAQKVIRQVVQVAQHCHVRGVFHRDIKPENILINPNTLEVKLIDFGCGELLKNEPYSDYSGTSFYCPPEWHLHKKYSAAPAVIWSLGIVLFELVCGKLPFKSKEKIVDGSLRFVSGLSHECCSLIMWCLERQPECRPTFSEILNHRWLKENAQDTVE
ncbi:aurora kinase-like isoform X1, partial [Clarias magur]